MACDTCTRRLRSQSKGHAVGRLAWPLALPLPWPCHYHGRARRKRWYGVRASAFTVRARKGGAVAATPGASWPVPQTTRRAFGSFSHDCFSYFPFIARLKSASIAYFSSTEFVASHSFMCACHFTCLPRDSCCRGTADGDACNRTPEVNSGSAVPGVSILGSSEHAQLALSNRALSGSARCR